MARPARPLLGPCLLAATALLSACGRDEEAPAAPQATQAALPAVPDVAKTYIGRSVGDFPTGKSCEGAFDAIITRHTGQDSGVEVEGWSWLKDENKPAAVVLFAQNNGKIEGGAETRVERADVPKAVHEVTLSKVGWHGVIPATSGKYDAYALGANGALCAVGSKSIS